MKIKLFSTAPAGRDEFWQLVILPNISIIRSPDIEDNKPYTVVNFEWLFWSVSFIID